VASFYPVILALFLTGDGTNRDNLGILPEKWLGYLDSVITIQEKS